MSAKRENESRPAKKPPGRIITFYSYKGGTGRTMLLANVAFILASRGKRVLVVDWDLEAPGLHRYFRPFMVDPDLTSSPGVIDMVTDYAIEAMTEVAPEDSDQFESADILRFASSLQFPFPKPGTIDVVPAGKQGPSYAARVNSFNWQNFYDRLGGGSFLEVVKRGMLEAYDYVLIDSRTGVSDTSGICTVQLPDALVVCFTLNDQSIEGASAIASSVKAQRPEAAFRVFPVPTRVEEAEKKKLEAARDLAQARFAEFLSHVQPERRGKYWGDVETPYVPFYAYEEVLAIFGDRPEQHRSMLAAAERVTGYITEGQVSRLAPMDDGERMRSLALFERGRRGAAAPQSIAKEINSSPFPEIDAERLPHDLHPPPSPRPTPPPPSAPHPQYWASPGRKSLLAAGAGMLTALSAIAAFLLIKAPPPSPRIGDDAGVADGMDAGFPQAPATSGDAIVAAAGATQDPVSRVLLLAELPVDAEPEGARALIEEVAKLPFPIAVMRAEKRQGLGAQFSADGKFVVVAASDGLRIWPSDGHKGARKLALENLTSFDVAGDFVAAASSDGYYGIWSISRPTLSEVRKQSTGLKIVRLSPYNPIHIEKGEIPSAARTRTWLRATTNSLYLRSLSEGALVVDESGDMEVAPIFDADISESKIVTVGATRVDVLSYDNNGIGKYSLATQKLSMLWSGAGATGTKAAFALDLRSVAVAADTGEIVAFPIDDNGQLGRRVIFQGLTGSIDALAVNGSELLASSGNKILSWSWAKPHEARVVATHQAPVRSLAFGHGGKNFVSASSDKIAKVFIAEDGRAEHRRTWDLDCKDALVAASFSDDEKRVVTVTEAGELRVWQLTSGIPLDESWPNLVRALRKATSACLSIADRRSLLEEPPEVATGRFIECEKSNGRSGILRGD